MRFKLFHSVISVGIFCFFCFIVFMFDSVVKMNVPNCNSLSLIYSNNSLHNYNQQDKITVLILTHNRTTRLIKALHNLNNATNIKEILIVWNDAKQEHLQLLDKITWKIPIKTIVKKTNKLTNRYDVYDHITTDGVYIQDDDVMVDVNSLKYAHEVWKHNTERLVGLVPKSHSYDEKLKTYTYIYNPTCNFSIVGSAVVLHKIWLKRYFTDIHPHIIQTVDELMNCEDILLNFLVSNHTGLPPIIISPFIRPSQTECTDEDCEGSRLSGRTDHSSQRDACLNNFVKFYSRMPLVYANYFYENR